MQSNYFDSMILGTITNGQGSMNAVEGMHRAALRAFAHKFARRLSLCLGAWRALSMKRMPATATPIAATCPSYSASRRQRDQRQERWMPGVVVVDAGTVGVC
jgi:L-asparaginase II